MFRHAELTNSARFRNGLSGLEGDWFWFVELLY